MPRGAGNQALEELKGRPQYTPWRTNRWTVNSSSRTTWWCGGQPCIYIYVYKQSHVATYSSLGKGRMVSNSRLGSTVT